MRRRSLHAQLLAGAAGARAAALLLAAAACIGTGAPVEVEGGIAFRELGLLEGLRAREVLLVNQGEGAVLVRARAPGTPAASDEVALLPGASLRLAPAGTIDLELRHPDPGRALVAFRLLGDPRLEVAYEARMDPGFGEEAEEER